MELLVHLQDKLVEIIDTHEPQLRESLVELGCIGDCYRCPMPEEANIEDQVLACLKSVTDGLGLEMPRF